VNALGMQGRMSIKYIFNITGSDDSKCVYPPQNMVLMAGCRHHSNKRSGFLQGERSSWIDDNRSSTFGPSAFVQPVISYNLNSHP
jgi:hypothetical protein